MILSTLAFDIATVICRRLPILFLALLLLSEPFFSVRLGPLSSAHLGTYIFSFRDCAETITVLVTIAPTALRRLLH
jgi:hypothetical protein